MTTGNTGGMNGTSPSRNLGANLNVASKLNQEEIVKTHTDR